jgi:uncharacterized protein YkwD
VNSFYILLFTSIITGCLAGYLSGFIKILFFFIKITAAVAVAYYLNSFVADIIPVDEEWAQPIAFISVFTIVFVISYLLVLYAAKGTNKFNNYFLNKAGGLIAGFAIALISVASIVQFTNIATIPKVVSDKIKASSLDDVLTDYAAIVNDKFVPLFQKQPVQVMASIAVDTIIKNGVTLSFTTNEFDTDAAMEKDMLQLINTERIKYGLKALLADTQLTTAARMHSADMFTRGYFSHNTPEGINPFQRLHKLNIRYLYAGENLAMAPTLLKAHEGLMRSPGHRANILNTSYGKVGIGILDGGIHGLMITQEFRD